MNHADFKSKQNENEIQKEDVRRYGVSLAIVCVFSFFSGVYDTIQHTVH